MKTELVYPKEMIAEARDIAPRPTWVDSLKVIDAKCGNCGDRGFMTAFFCDHDRSLLEGRSAPHLENGKSLMSVDGHWWLGEHKTYDCPLCRNGNGRVSI